MNFLSQLGKVEKVFFLSFSALCFLAFLSPPSTDFSGFSFALDVFLLAVCALGVAVGGAKLGRLEFFSLVFVGGYVVFSLIYSYFFNENHILDFVLVYKSFIYLFLCLISLRANIFGAGFYVLIFRFLLVLFFLRYVALFLVGVDRPSLFYENNFELMLLLVMFVVKLDVTKKWAYWEVFFLFLIVFLSGSRSAAVIFLASLAVMAMREISLRQVVLLGFVSPVLVSFVYYIFASRGSGGSIEDIDRVRFALIFFEETEGWSVFDFLFGAERVTPLSIPACNALGYYKTLFSYSEDGSCYSVILHSYVLRMVFDHGFFVFSFVLFVIFNVSVKNGYSYQAALSFVLIVVLNGLSVSSFNSVYYALPFLLAMQVGLRDRM